MLTCLCIKSKWTTLKSCLKLLRNRHYQEPEMCSSDLREGNPTLYLKRRPCPLDLRREIDKVYDLYVLAMDELNYAGDSQGTLYYVNDRESAQEAIENFSNASMQLLSITHDPERSQLQTMIQARLHHLQTRFNALPEQDSLNHRSTYCS